MRALVFNKIYQNLNNKKAWGVRIPCFTFLCMAIMSASFITVPVAMAQSSDLNNRLNRLENELDTLNRAVYKGEKPPQQIYNTSSNVGGSNNQAMAQMELRLQQLETQMRELTGRVEEQVYTINQLKNDVGFLQNKVAKIPSANASENSGAITRTPAARLDPSAVVRPEETPASPANPLNLDLSAQEPSGMQVASPIKSTSDATAKYEAAYKLIQDKKYDDARASFRSFLTDHPAHVLSANAKYWLGETYYVEGSYDQAARAFAQGFQQFPDSAKSPDMLLKLGLSLANLDKKDEACIALAQLPIKFKVGPQTVLDRGAEERSRLNCSAG